MNDKILTPKQVAEFLQISKAKIYVLIKRKEIPHIRLGRNVRIIESELMKWIEECKVATE